MRGWKNDFSPTKLYSLTLLVQTLLTAQTKLYSLALHFQHSHSEFQKFLAISRGVHQTAEYGFGAPEIYFGAVLGAPKVHYIIILNSLARPNPLLDFCRRYALCSCRRFTLIFDTTLYYFHFCIAFYNL